MSQNSLSHRKIQSKSFTDGMHFLKIKSYASEDRKYTGKLSKNGVWLYYNHHSNSGKAEFQNFTNSPYKKNLCSIAIINQDEAKVSVKKGPILSSSITLEKEFLLKNLPEGNVKEKIIESLETNRPAEQLARKDITPQSQLILNNIYNNPFNNQLDELYSQSKILELIYLELKSLIDIEPNKNNKLKLDAYDIEAIKKAKEILIQNMHNPPNIEELSRQVKINQFKLKNGFKKVFNDTPYNTLLQYKLEHAKELVIESELNIGEIAELVGYKSLSSFTKAFTKKHGLRPIDLMKSRKYYY